MKIKTLLLIAMAVAFGATAFSQNLADQVTGEYKGRLKKQSTDQNDFYIKITKVSDNQVKIQPKNGSLSHTFKVNLYEENMGTIKIIKFKYSTDHILNNGMYVDQNKRLTYAIHLGGDEMSNIEVFSGEKQ